MSQAQIDPKKYVVFKREDIEHRLAGKALMSEYELEDCVVLRKKDTFTAGALYAYASSVASAAEILRDTDAVDQDTLDRLTALADYFAGEADHARQIHGRIPD